MILSHPHASAAGHALRSDVFHRHVRERQRGSRLSTMSGSGGALALSSLTLLFGAPAHAQQQEQQQVLEEIQVTGSRIERTGFTTPVPVTAMSRDELTAIDPGNLVESLNQLPQFLNSDRAQARGTFLGAAGQSLLNIRGMGSSRTLVLLDGRRIVPGNRLSSVDINLFPQAMIQRVEVVTGGASAAYGADAVAGVANFILDRQYTGFEGHVQGGMTAQHLDGANWEASLAGGFPLGDRAHVIASVEALGMREVRGRVAGLDDRSWFQDWGWVTNPAWSPADPPGTNPQRLTLPHVHSTNFSPAGLINQPGFAFDRHVFLADGESTRLYKTGAIGVVRGGTNSTSGGPEYELARLASRTDLTDRNKRRNAFASVDYELNDDTTVFLQGILGRMEGDRPHSQSSPGTTGIWHATIFQDNAFLPEHIRQAMIDEGRESFNMLKTGTIPGVDTLRDGYHDGTVTTQYSLTTGVQTVLPNGWNLNAHYQFGQSKMRMLLRDMIRVDRLFLAMDAVVDPETGGIICNVQRFNPTLEELAESVADVLVPYYGGMRGIASPVGLDDTIQNCVPINLFGNGNASPEAAAYVIGDKFATSTVQQHFGEVMVTGDIHQGWGAGPISIAAGATFREESLDQAAGPEDIEVLGPPQNAPHLGIRGISPGFTGGAPNLHRLSNLTTFRGAFNVWEAFSEVLLPLYAAPSGGQRVDLNVAARFAEYSRAGGIWTWKTGLDFQVTNDLRVRGTYSRDSREGTFAEMFDAQGGGGSVDDPLFDNQNFPISSVQGGNPDIEPEEAKTITVGFVYQPSFVPGMQFAVDYYDIDLDGAIGQLGVQRVVDECHAGATQFCGQIERDATTNIITRVWNTFVNIDNRRVNGIDLELRYRMQPNFFSGQSESLTFRALAGYLGENSTTPRAGVKQDTAGAGSTPEWTTMASVSYNLGPWAASLNHRYIDGLTRNVNWTEGVEVDMNRVASATYVSTRVGYTHETTAGSWELYGHVSNLFDRTPPLYAGGTGISSLHDQLGRRFVVGAHFRY